MAKITPENAFEFECHKFTSEASTLGLAPGEWPDAIDTTLGNGRPFRLCDADTDAGELVAVRYTQDLGCISLTIANT